MGNDALTEQSDQEPGQAALDDVRAHRKNDRTSVAARLCHLFAQCQKIGVSVVLHLVSDLKDIFRRHKIFSVLDGVCRDIVKIQPAGPGDVAVHTFSPFQVFFTLYTNKGKM